MPDSSLFFHTEAAPSVPTYCFGRNYFMSLCFFFLMKLSPSMKATCLHFH